MARFQAVRTSSTPIPALRIATLLNSASTCSSRIAATAVAQKSLKPAIPQTSRVSWPSHGRTAAAWPAGRIEAGLVPPMPVGAGRIGLSRFPA